MAEEIQDRNVGAAGDFQTSSEPPKNVSPGVVLGKDGKPCRPCTSFAAFATQTTSFLKTSSTGREKSSVVVAKNDCPADVETLGRSGWTLLHSIAATYPSTPTATEQADLKSFVRLFSRLYPCWSCAEDFQSYIKNQPMQAGNRDEFGNWLCEAHNDVNRKLGKPTFDCSRWEERWRTGWKDGRCD